MPSFWSSVPNSPWNSRRSKLMPWRKRHFERGVDHFLGGDRRERGHAGDRRGGFQRFVEQVGGGNDLGHQARRAQLPRRPSSARSGTFPSPWPCRRPSVSRCDPPMPGVTPNLISGWPNLAVSAAMMKSAIIATSHPPPNAKPATAAIHGLRVAVTCSHPAKKLEPIHVGEALGLHFLDVGARGERLFGAGQDKAALRRVGVVVGKSGDEVGQNLAVERVERLRPIQGNERHRVAPFDQDGFVAHAHS